MAQNLFAGGSPRLDLLERLAAAFNARTFDALDTLFHERVEFWPTDEYLPAGTSYHGLAGVISMLNQGSPEYPGAQIEFTEAVEFEDRVVAVIRLTVDGGAPRESYWVYSFEDGKIARAEQYPTRRAALAAGEHFVLTPRERQVFQLLARGFTGPEIAEQLVLSPETVRTHVQNGVDRLGASTRVQAVAMALASGEIEA